MPSLDTSLLADELEDAFDAAVGADKSVAALAIAEAIDKYIVNSLSTATAGGDSVTPGKTIVE